MPEFNLSCVGMHGLFLLVVALISLCAGAAPVRAELELAIIANTLVPNQAVPNLTIFPSSGYEKLTAGLPLVHLQDILQKNELDADFSGRWPIALQTGQKVIYKVNTAEQTENQLDCTLFLSFLKDRYIDLSLQGFCQIDEKMTFFHHERRLKIQQIQFINTKPIDLLLYIDPQTG